MRSAGLMWGCKSLQDMLKEKILQGYSSILALGDDLLDYEKVRKRFISQISCGWLFKRAFFVLKER